MKKVSIVVPAYNEAEHLALTLQAVRSLSRCDELIVVDDGSIDQTGSLARQWADDVVVHPQNKGKGAALLSGFRRSSGEIVVFLDADLRESACHADRLIQPVYAGVCDMAVARLPSPAKAAGFGLTKGLARGGIRLLTGFAATAPLSGQRAIRREVLESAGKWDKGFGIEVGLTVDALRSGFRLLEVPVPFSHRVTGGDWRGMIHRGKEFVAVGRALSQKWREGIKAR